MVELAAHSIFFQMALLLSIATAIGAIGTLLRQPLIVSFIFVGIFAGPTGLSLLNDSTHIKLFSELGIAILLFLVGLKLDLKLIKQMGPVALATGLGQVFFTSIIGYFISRGLGFEPTASLYIAVALTFSSTIIIVKLLSDKGEIDSLHGQISVGFLIVQDLVVILVMILLSGIGGENSTSESMSHRFFHIIIKSFGFLAAVGILMRFGLPQLMRLLAKSKELMVLFAVAWATVLAASAHEAGLSKEVGAFLAGVSLASLPYRDSLGARLVGLRDFLLLFFFLELGSGLNFGILGEQLGTSIVLSFFVLFGNPLIVLIIMGIMGYRSRTGFLAGLTVAQISEFSLIFATLGVSLGHISTDILGLVTLVGITTIGVSTYLITYSHQIYEWSAPILKIFEKTNLKNNQETHLDSERPEITPDVILFGLGRFGSSIADNLKEKKLRILGIDFNPQAIQKWNNRGLCAKYGDAEDPEYLKEIPLNKASWVVITVPHAESSLILLSGIRDQGFKGKIAMIAHRETEAKNLEKLGVTLVIRTYSQAALSVAKRILNEL